MAHNQEYEQTWHNDGHTLHLRINKSDLEIIDILCPHEGASPCKNIMGDCIVTWFVNRFGMDCNGGLCPPSEFMEISWTLVGDINNFDSCQLWFMPLNDEIFNAWIITNTHLVEE
jgi:hypothetical protein